MTTKSIISAENLVLGRLASRVAKRLLGGDTIIIVNAEKALITGTKESVMRTYNFKRDVGTRRKGPYYPRTPDRMLKRTVRGMVNYQTPRGRAAYKRLKVFLGTPAEFEGAQIESVKDARTQAARSVTLETVARELGFEVKL
ncbi:MAG TPA: 50S ribosomal protein L13 [Candidatus Thermoplasmatota archaeon]|jgi:large subunit ribosomal protein L13|nr:50S ribosomal protein L13 [Candidatus Thermoplasmatota archaeon]